MTVFGLATSPAAAARRPLQGARQKVRALQDSSQRVGQMRQAIIEHRQRAKGVVAAPFLVLDNQRPCAAIRFVHVAAMASHPVRRFIEQAGGFVLRYGDVGVG